MLNLKNKNILEFPLPQPIVISKKCKDLTNQIFGRLHSIYPCEKDKNNRILWVCKCECGKYLKVISKNLLNGNTKSCGCLHKEKAIESNFNRSENLIDKKFGRLTVIKEIGFKTDKNSNKRKRIYLCLCSCGNYCNVQHQYLTYGDVNSCGCLNSKGEMQVEHLLQSNKINYSKQYIFEDLKDISFLRFDFAIFNNNRLKQLIEIHGIQHYDITNKYSSPELLKHDIMKKEYCLSHSIPLIIIDFSKSRRVITLKELQLEEE